jgi:hypothetical protein
MRSETRSWCSCPFGDKLETNPHPALLRSVKLSLRTREIDCLEYQASANPPILHRKKSFRAPLDKSRRVRSNSCSETPGRVF